VRVLAWDTSTRAGGIALVEDGVLRGEWTLNLEATHAERLLWGIHQLLQGSRLELRQIDCFGVGLGPGSFTGLRIGISTARALGFATKIPLVGFSSLAALARPTAEAFAATRQKVLVVAALDAAKGQLFSISGHAKLLRECVWRGAPSRAGWRAGVEEEVVDPEILTQRIIQKLKRDSDLRWSVVGDGKRSYPDLWSQVPKRKQVEPPVLSPDQIQGRAIATLAWQAAQAGWAKPATEWLPDYLRKSDPELKLERGLLKPAP
jgi:tRNA threonylcarbamoyladenosine biosynthesis protein TsaB